MDFSFKEPIATNSGTPLWKEEFRSFRAIDYVYLFSMTTFAAIGLLALVRRLVASYFGHEPDFECPAYQVQNGDMGPPLIEGFAKVRDYKMEPMQPFTHPICHERQV